MNKLSSVSTNIDRLGTIGLFLTAILSPCCFPIFAFAASAFGLGSFELFGSNTMWIFQAMVLISLIGLYMSYRKHNCMYPLFVAIPSALSIFYGYYINESDVWMCFLYGGMLGLLVSTIWNNIRNSMNMKNQNEVELSSTLTCPHCGFQKVEVMPTDSCQFFYKCESCEAVLKPKQGDCCVYCSYGTVPCPPIQSDKKCCG